MGTRKKVGELNGVPFFIGDTVSNNSWNYQILSSNSVRIISPNSEHDGEIIPVGTFSWVKKIIKTTPADWKERLEK